MLFEVTRCSGIGPDAFVVFIDALAKPLEEQGIKAKNFAVDVKLYLRMQNVECSVTVQNALNLIGDEFRNVSVTADAALSRNAYAMSRLSAEALTQRLAAGRGNGYPLAEATAAAIARSPVHRTAEHWTTGLAAKPLVSINKCSVLHVSSMPTYSSRC